MKKNDIILCFTKNFEYIFVLELLLMLIANIVFVNVYACNHCNIDINCIFNHLHL